MRANQAACQSTVAWRGAEATTRDDDARALLAVRGVLGKFHAIMHSKLRFVFDLTRER